MKLKQELTKNTNARSTGTQSRIPCWGKEVRVGQIYLAMTKGKMFILSMLFGQEAELGKHLTPVNKSVMNFSRRCLFGSLLLATRRVDPVQINLVGDQKQLPGPMNKILVLGLLRHGNSRICLGKGRRALCSDQTEKWSREQDAGMPASPPSWTLTWLQDVIEPLIQQSSKAAVSPEHRPQQSGLLK